MKGCVFQLRNRLKIKTRQVNLVKIPKTLLRPDVGCGRPDAVADPLAFLSSPAQHSWCVRSLLALIRPGASVARSAPSLAELEHWGGSVNKVTAQTGSLKLVGGSGAGMFSFLASGIKKHYEIGDTLGKYGTPPVRSAAWLLC